jgi:hypothetical protein
MTGAIFGEAVASWHDFHAALAGIAATLIGLLFVGLALNPAVMRDDGPDGMRTWAGLTFHNFLIVLAIALTALIPDQTAPGMGIPLAILGAQGVYRVARDIGRARRDPDPDWQGMRALGRFAAPGLGYVLCVWAAVLAWQEDTAAMDVLVWVIFLLLMSAAASCWDLLKAIGNQPAGR